MTRKLYAEIATKVDAMLNCIKSNNAEWTSIHAAWLLKTCKDGPSGAGIDCGTKLDLDRSTGERLVFTFSYHHMDDNGYYSGWTEHTLTVRPSLRFGCDLTISGRDRNQIKDYLHEVYSHWLESEVEPS